MRVCDSAFPERHSRGTDLRNTRVAVVLRCGLLCIPREAFIGCCDRCRFVDVSYGGFVFIKFCV